MARDAEPVIVDLVFLGQTAAAYLFRDGDEGDPEHWVPKSLAEPQQEPEVGRLVKVEMPEWKAVELGLV